LLSTGSVRDTRRIACEFATARIQQRQLLARAQESHKAQPSRLITDALRFINLEEKQFNIIRRGAQLLVAEVKG
jgi:hypothetical protein